MAICLISTTAVFWLDMPPLDFGNKNPDLIKDQGWMWFFGYYVSANIDILLALPELKVTVPVLLK